MSSFQVGKNIHFKVRKLKLCYFVVGNIINGMYEDNIIKK
jgi:hypothetical protein